uniref:Retrovirus-related Pol polyprotein from transposon TNT 1-94 n=1 Tax=Tanacetum cinerariifolium TaxID=118510 RepID=A0A6L2JUV8_TANCI|nr:retrovirus-related Pol polyprotein from transposon TNT 1-94 [Tanacetum cinerariifolium]
MQTQTSNALHNAIMEAGSKDSPPMLAPGIDNDIYSTVDASPNACEMWKAIERLKQGESINVQDLETNLYWEFGKFTSRDEWKRFVTLVKQNQEQKTVSYHKLYEILKQHQNKVNEIRAKRLAHTANPLALVSQQQPVYHSQNNTAHYTQNSSTRSQQATTRSRGKAIVNSSLPIYDQEPSMVAKDDEMSKDKEIDKLMALISLSFKKIYKPTNNNLRTSSNTNREEVYVNQPDGFVDPYHRDKVYRLKKALYGLKQAPRAWYYELSNFMVAKGFSKAKPTEKHHTVVKWIFRYLKDTINMGLWYPKDTGFELTAFLDLDHTGCLDSRKSTSGGIQFLGGDKLISWSSKKQDYTLMSLVEAEYVSLSACCAQVLWMRTQLIDYGFHFDKIPMYCDSKVAIAISCNQVLHSRTKHIDVRYHFIKEKVEKGIIKLFFVRTEYELADLFTKALSEDRFKYLVRRLGMRCLTPEELEVLANESS